MNINRVSVSRLQQNIFRPNCLTQSIVNSFNFFDFISERFSLPFDFICTNIKVGYTTGIITINADSIIFVQSINRIKEYFLYWNGQFSNKYVFNMMENDTRSSMANWYFLDGDHPFRTLSNFSNFWYIPPLPYVCNRQQSSDTPLKKIWPIMYPQFFKEFIISWKLSICLNCFVFHNFRKSILGKYQVSDIIFFKDRWLESWIKTQCYSWWLCNSNLFFKLCGVRQFLGKLLEYHSEVINIK